MKVNITKRITRHTSIGVDLQHRRQSGFDNGNMLHYRLTSSIRLWTYYKPGHDWSLIFSPIAFFDNQVKDAVHKELQGAKEVRTALGAMKAFAAKKATVSNRMLYEVSIITTADPEKTIRQRYRFQNALSYPLRSFSGNTGLNYQITNELLIQSMRNNLSLDQNRLYSGFQWKMLQADINLGYQITVQKRKRSTYKNQLLIAFNVTL